MIGMAFTIQMSFDCIYGKYDAFSGDAIYFDYHDHGNVQYSDDNNKY